MIAFRLILLLLLAFFAVVVITALVGFVAGRTRARHEPRSKSHGLFRTGVVLAILMFLMLGLFVSVFTVRLSTQGELRQVAMRQQDRAITETIATQYEALQDPYETAVPDDEEIRLPPFSAREGAPPEPLDDFDPTTVKPTSADAVSTPATETAAALAPRDASGARPAWIGAAPKRVGPVYRTVVVSDPYVTKMECDQALDPQMHTVALQYIDDLLGEGARRFVELDTSTVRSQIARDEYVELLDTSVGPMQRVHVLMEFDDPLRAEFRQRYQEGRRECRLYQAGGGAVIFVALLSVIFGYLTLDTATRGYYTRRLQLAATAAILLIVFLGLSLNRAI